MTPLMKYNSTKPLKKEVSGQSRDLFFPFNADEAIHAGFRLLLCTRALEVSSLDSSYL